MFRGILSLLAQFDMYRNEERLAEDLEQYQLFSEANRMFVNARPMGAWSIRNVR